MGQIIGSGVSNALTPLQDEGKLLQAKSGPIAIAVNDLLVLGGVPTQLYPAQTSDYAAVAAAGSSPVALTTVSSFGSQFETRDRAVVDFSNGDIFIADTYLTGPVGCQIWKYNSQGVLQRAVILDSASTGGTNYVQTRFLSNGNILVFWYNVATPYTLFFAIVNKNLGIVVAKTAIASVSTDPQANAHCIALSGGGFAIAYSHTGVGDYFTIRNDAGAVVYAPTVIAGSPSNSSANSNGPRHKLVQLSDGNIFVGFNDTNDSSNDTNDSSNGLRYCIFSVIGGVVKAFTTINASGAGGNYPEVDILPGFVLLSNGSNSYVLNNAGTIQGAVIPLATGSTTRVSNDGTYFWVFQSSGGLVCKRIPTTGTGVVTNTLVRPAGISADIYLERGNFISYDGTNAYVISMDANGVPAALVTTTFPASLGMLIGGIGDFCALGFQVGKFQITKLMSASIFGISQATVAAGNAGTVVPVNVGPGGYATNQMRGTVGKAFDHSSATIVGNKGALYLNSAALKGI